jgi:hypothetical protein
MKRPTVRREGSVIMVATRYQYLRRYRPSLSKFDLVILLSDTIQRFPCVSQQVE